MGWAGHSRSARPLLSWRGVVKLKKQLRIQQTIKSQEGIIMTYRIANLLQFYLVTMRRTIGDQALLCRTIQE
jgi:hypothetical protein